MHVVEKRKNLVQISLDLVSEIESRRPDQHEPQDMAQTAAEGVPQPAQHSELSMLFLNLQFREISGACRE